MASRSVITIGNFDGVHRGHRAIIARARQIASEYAPCALVAMAFDPHPATVLRPDRAPRRLMSRRRKIDTLRSLGVDEVVILEPTSQLLSSEPEAFIESLVGERQPIAFVEGPDFRFGRGRRGDDQLLASLGSRHGFELTVVEPIEVALNDLLVMPVSSSNIRWLLNCGRVADAARCLGEVHRLEAPVVAGDRRGHELGFPTANLDTAALDPFVIPANGVYAGLTTLPDGRIVPSAISVGVKPTFGRTTRLVEAHLLDFDGDLYEQTLSVSFSRWLRDQQPFPGPSPLQAQLRRDVNQTRQLHQLGLLTDPARTGPAAAG